MGIVQAKTVGRPFQAGKDVSKGPEVKKLGTVKGPKQVDVLENRRVSSRQSL